VTRGRLLNTNLVNTAAANNGNNNNNNRDIKSIRIRWAGARSTYGESRGVYRVLVAKL
jgi:hypothetical protein